MKPSVCLNMIVRNEAPVIQRCLATVKPWITTWVISDTGSTDGTQELIKEFMKDIPGTLIERPWVDFAHNRNEVLEIAKNKADFSFFIDADERFIPNLGLLELPSQYDYYTIKIREQSSFYERIFLFRNACDISWQGVLHEMLSSVNPCSKGFFNQGEILSITQDGHRFTDPDKYLKDAQVLENALKKEPNNSRYTFYLGQSYSNTKELDLALQAYEKRTEMEGDPDEKFFSLFMIGALQEHLGYDPKIYANSFLKAHQFRPYRHEPLYGIAVYFVKMEWYEEAYRILKKALNMNVPEDSIFVQDYMRDYQLPYLFTQCCYFLKKYDECFQVGTELLAKPKISSEMAIELNRNLCALRSEIKSLEIYI